MNRIGYRVAVLVGAHMDGDAISLGLKKILVSKYGHRRAYNSQDNEHCGQKFQMFHPAILDVFIVRIPFIYMTNQKKMAVIKLK